MYALAERSRSNQSNTNSGPISSGRSHARHGLDAGPMQHACGTLGSHAVRRLLEAGHWGGRGDSSAGGMDRFPSDFGGRAEHGSGPGLAQHNSPTAPRGADATGGHEPVPHDEGTRSPVLNAPVATAQTAPTTQTAPVVQAPQTAPARQPSSQPGAAAPPKASATNAPAAQAIIPFDTSPLASPGERIIFNAVLTDPSPGDYQLEYSTTGGHFNTDTGATTVTVAGLSSGNLSFFVPTPWDGRSAVTVTLIVRKKSDHSAASTTTWTFGLKAHIPTTVTQKEGTGERNMPAIYTYDLGPALPPAHKPFYEHLTILERFDSQHLANITPEDIKPAYRTAHALNTADAVSRAFVDPGSGGNGTFTVDANDQIFDQHSGTFNLATLVANLVAPKDIEVALPQTYEATPGTALGRYTITRVLKSDGTTWKVKKGPR